MISAIENEENSLPKILNVQIVESKIYSIYAFHSSLDSSVSHHITLANIAIVSLKTSHLIQTSSQAFPE